jgi:hypothetical protein
MAPSQTFIARDPLFTPLRGRQPLALTAPLILLTCCVAVALLAACGGGSDATTTTTTTTTPTSDCAPAANFPDVSLSSNHIDWNDDGASPTITPSNR